MRFSRNIIAFLITLLMVISANLPINALNTGFTTEAVSDEDQARVTENLNLSILQDEPPKDGIECFAVNQEGLIALGFNQLKRKYIGIYSTEGEYQYGFAFNSYGDFDLEWDDEELRQFVY